MAAEQKKYTQADRNSWQDALRNPPLPKGVTDSKEKETKIPPLGELKKPSRDIQWDERDDRDLL